MVGKFCEEFTISEVGDALNGEAVEDSSLDELEELGLDNVGEVGALPTDCRLSAGHNKPKLAGSEIFFSL